MGVTTGTPALSSSVWWHDLLPRRSVATTTNPLGLDEEMFISIDSFSTDRTLDICEELDVKVIQNKWEGYCNQKNFMIKNCKTKWILSLDSDEILKRAVFIPININMKDDTPFILLNSLKIALKS